MTASLKGTKYEPHCLRERLLCPWRSSWLPHVVPARLGPLVVHKPQGTFTPRVQPVGHEHFGIVGINCAQAGSNLFLCDFYGRAGKDPHWRGGLA